MADLTRQQLCAALGVSESTIRRLERDGLPYTPIGARTKRYDLAECKQWLREREGEIGVGRRSETRSVLSPAGVEFAESARKMKLRVKPS